METKTAASTTTHKALFSLNAKIGGINPVEAVLTDTDLATQILKRVPPKPLTTFQVVSKNWLSLISDPHFVSAHTRHLITTHHQSSIECLPKLDVVEGVQYNAPTQSSPKILSSCNGLILYQNGQNMPYIVINPTTRKRRVIPEPVGSLGDGRGLAIVLAFDPLKSFNYNIIRFHCADSTINIDIFSSESEAWKKLHFQDPSWVVRCSTRQIFWNGAIHWMTYPNIHVQFIVDEEKFIWERIPTNPGTFPEGGEFGYFGKSDNGLLLMKYSSREPCYGWIDDHPDRKDEVFTVLEIDKDNFWFPKHQVDLKPLAPIFPDMNCVLEDGSRGLKYSVLYVKSGARSEDFSVVLSIPDNVILYEERKGNGDTGSKVVYDFPNAYEQKLDLYHNMHPFIGCLAPVL